MSKKRKILLYLTGSIALIFFYFFMTGWHLSRDTIINDFSKAHLLSKSSYVFTYELDKDKTLHVFQNGEDIKPLITERFLFFHRPFSAQDADQIIFDQEGYIAYLGDKLTPLDQMTNIFAAYNTEVSRFEMTRFPGYPSENMKGPQEVYPHLFIGVANDDTYGGYVTIGYNKNDDIVSLYSQTSLRINSVNTFIYDRVIYDSENSLHIEDVKSISEYEEVEEHTFPADPVLVVIGRSGPMYYYDDSSSTGHYDSVTANFYLRDDGNYDVIQRSHSEYRNEARFSKHVVHKFSFNQLLEQLFKEYKNNQYAP